MSGKLPQIWFTIAVNLRMPKQFDQVCRSPELGIYSMCRSKGILHFCHPWSLIMKTLFVLASFLAFAGSANATIYVWIDGQANDISNGASYSHYLENSNVTLTDDKTVNNGDLIHGSFGSSSSMGTLRSYSHVDTVGLNLPLLPEAESRGQYRDSVTVGGTGQITLKFSMPTSGSYAPGSYNALELATLDVNTDAGALSQPLIDFIYKSRMNNGVLTIDNDSTVGEITVDAGTKISLFGYLATRATTNCQNPLALMSGVDFSHTSESFIEVLTPGGTLTSQSGHNYSPVPEPATFLALGLGLTFLARRRKA